MIIKVSSHKKAAICYWFDNGNSVSIVFGAYTYSDNYNSWKADKQPDILESTTVEIMPSGNASFIKWVEKKYDGMDVVGYVPVSEIPKIVKRADSRVYVQKEDI